MFQARNTQEKFCSPKCRKQGRRERSSLSRNGGRQPEGRQASILRVANRADGYLPAKPFADWLNVKIRKFEHQYVFMIPAFARKTGREQRHVYASSSGPTQDLARMLGWLDRNGNPDIRAIYRKRNQLMTLGTRETHTDWFPRLGVEDTLHYVGGPALVWTLYPGTEPGSQQYEHCAVCERERLTFGSDALYGTNEAARFCGWCQTQVMEVMVPA